MTWCREETITVAQPLTQAEKAAYAEEMARLDAEIQSIDEERDRVMKSLKKQSDAKEEERRELSRAVNEGHEEQEVYCDLLKDWNTFEMVWVEAEPPYREVLRRAMTEEEKQPSLLDRDDKPQTPAEVAQAVEAAEAIEGQKPQTDKVQ